ncbi:MAG: MBL fold metallo-hydrolase [Leptospiraceae bacterium]|nr:MBL fold metallo-hydrolase [Leptospiraceae bacterium]
MKKFLKIFLSVIIIIMLIIFCIISLNGIGKEIPNEKIIHHTEPEIKTNHKISLNVIETAFGRTLEGFVRAGGSFFKEKLISHNAVVIKHPKGNIMIDGGLGMREGQDFKQIPFYLKPFFYYKFKQPAKDVLDKYNIKINKIILTHMHWDHVGSIRDFESMEVITRKEEFEFAKTEMAEPPAYIKSQYLDSENFTLIEFSNIPYEIFSKSFDIYNDGSIVLVPLEGHSPGSIGIFVNISQKERYFFIGDITWMLEGIIYSSHKYYISSLLVDFNKENLGKEINRIHQFAKLHPEIRIIPSHDFVAYWGIERLNLFDQ